MKHLKKYRTMKKGRKGNKRMIDKFFTEQHTLRPCKEWIYKQRLDEISVKKSVQDYLEGRITLQEYLKKERLFLQV